MKKILTIFALAALFTGCGDLYGPEPQPQNPVSGKAVAITVDPSGINDTGFSAEITPAEQDVFCSYVLCKEAQASQIDPDALLKCTVSGVKCTMTATAYTASGEKIDTKTSDSGKGISQASKIVLEFTNLEQNTTYFLYAVAASTTGLPGQVFNAPVTTTDARVPSQTAAATFDATTASVVFSQPVTFRKGTKVEVRYYAVNTKSFKEAQCADSYELSDDDVVVDGQNVQFTYHPENLPAGAYFTINYPDGAFVSDTKVPCKGCSADYTFDADGETVVAVDEQGQKLTVFNGSRVETTTFTMTAPKESEVFDPISSEWNFTHNSEISGIAKVDPYMVVKYFYGNEAKSTSFNLEFGSGWGYTLDENMVVTGISVMLPELPETPGDSLVIEVPAGLLIDAYGNISDAVRWGAKFMQLDEIGTGLFSEPVFLEIENEECTLFYNPSSDVYRIANCFGEGYNLEFKWNQETNKCEIIGRQDTGWLYSAGVGILVCDAHGYYSKNTWEEIVAAGFKQPYYEDGIFVFPNVAYVLTNGQATSPQFTITYNMGRDITEPQLEGIWSCTSVTDYWGDTYGPFNVAIQQAVDEAGVPVENVYSIVNLAPRLATMGVTARTFGTWDADNSQLVIAYDETSNITAGGTPITYKGFDNADPAVAEYYDDVYFSVSAIPAAMVNLNAYGMMAGTSNYELYYGGAMQLKRTGDLPVTASNCVEASESQLKAISPKATKVNALESCEGSFFKKGKEAYLMPASKARTLK